MDRRSEAIALLQEERDGLEVTFTLPVMPYGLDEESLALLESANDHDVEIATVNLMTMNYAESYDDDMGDYALDAARSAHAQLRDVFGLSGAEAWRGMALTRCSASTTWRTRRSRSRTRHRCGPSPRTTVSRGCRRGRRSGTAPATGTPRTTR